MENELKVVNIRLVDAPAIESQNALTSPEDVCRFAAREISTYDREVMAILNLNAKGQILHMHVASMGTIDACMAVPREIFKAGILCNAHSIIAIHNHPSGDPTPSKEDIYVTHRLEAAGELLGISLKDHIIIGGGTQKAMSFCANEFLKKDVAWMEQQVLERNLEFTSYRKEHKRQERRR